MKVGLSSSQLFSPTWSKQCQVWIRVSSDDAQVATRWSRETLYACGLKIISVCHGGLTFREFIVQSSSLHPGTFTTQTTSCLHHDGALEGGNVVRILCLSTVCTVLFEEATKVTRFPLFRRHNPMRVHTR